MKFSSIKEYFYKLQSMCYACMLLPLAVMILLYAIPRALSSGFFMNDKELIQWLLIAFPVFVLIELTTVHWVIHILLKRMITMPGMGDRLDKYVSVVVIRTATGVMMSLLMLLGLYSTGDVFFTGYAVAMLGIVFLQRPTPAGVVSDLKLRGSEKELILKGELV